MDHKDLCKHTKIRLIAAAIGHQQCTKTAANVIPLPGTDRVITIGTRGEVARLLAGSAAEQPTDDLPALPLDLDNTNPRISMHVKAGELAELIHRWGREVYLAGQSQATRAIPEGWRETLQAAKRYIEQEGEISGYGFSRPANPHHFHPDAECCSPEEIAAHKAACEAYDKGEYTPERGSEWVGSMHILRAPWGIGGYSFMDEQASKIIGGIAFNLERAALARAPLPGVVNQEGGANA